MIEFFQTLCFGAPGAKLVLSLFFSRQILDSDHNQSPDFPVKAVYLELDLRLKFISRKAFLVAIRLIKLIPISLKTVGLTV